MANVQEVVISGEKVFYKDDLYQMMAEQLVLPETQGANLDTLWDTLRVWNEPLTITVNHQGLILGALGLYGHTFLETLDALQGENQHITVVTM